MRLAIDITNAPPSALQIAQARAGLKRQFSLLAMLFPASIIGLALADNAYTAQACITLLFSGVMFLLSRTNDNELLILQDISPYQSAMLGNWATQSASVALYRHRVTTQQRQITEREFVALRRFVDQTVYRTT